MRRLSHVVVVAAAALTALAVPAAAAVKTTVKTTQYSISGRNGSELLNQMDRRGPKHGFLTRAIAQTSYTVNWEIGWANKGGTCRLREAKATLSITYIYPNATGPMSADLKKRWATFMKGVRKHEEMHGVIAQKMVKAADRAIAGFSTQNDPNCRRAQAAVKRKVDAVYAEYEAQQARFDRVEHRNGGGVDQLVRALKR
jgi:predicted secreted Zn-dependent protease